MTPRQLFEATRENGVPLSVLCISGSAADNAVLTIRENGGIFTQGHFTDEFITYWHLGVQGLLSEDDCDPEAFDWFKTVGKPKPGSGLSM